MSDDYYLHCKTCDDRLDIDNQKSPEALQDLWAHRRAIAKARRALPFLGGIDGVRIVHRPPIRTGTAGMVDTPMGVYLINWFAEHKKHDVIVVDEFGRVVGECNALVDCPHCGSRVVCKLDPGHEGHHMSRRSKLLDLVARYPMCQPPGTGVKVKMSKDEGDEHGT